MESARAEPDAIGRAGRLAAAFARRLATRGAPGRSAGQGRAAAVRAAWGRLGPERRGPGYPLLQHPPHWTGLRLAWPDWMVLGRIRVLGPLARTQNQSGEDDRGRQRDRYREGTAAGRRTESRGVPLAGDAGRGPALHAAPRGAARLSGSDGPSSRAARIERAARPEGGQQVGVRVAPPTMPPALPPTTPMPARPARLDPGAKLSPAQPRPAGMPAGPPQPGAPRPAAAPDTAGRPAPRGPDLGWNLWGRLALPGRILGHGFEWLHAASRVARVHDDARADRIARAYGAEALTLGQEIFFRSGRLDPGSARGLSLLAHELTHVWQQARPGGVRDALEARRHEAALESEATRTERAVARAAGPVDGSLPGSRPDPRSAPPALVLPRPAPAPARVEAAPRSAPTPAPAAPALRAAEDRPGETGGEAGGGPDIAELTAEVYRRLIRRMRIDQERLGVRRG